MVHCVSASCRQEISESWSFCPYCGIDNRAPEARSPIRNCGHVFSPTSSFCIYCGAGREGQFSRSQWSIQILLCVLAIFAGILSFTAAFLIWWIHGHPTTSGYEWVHSWYDQTYVRYGRYGSSYPRQRGVEDLQMMVMAGVVFTIGGLSLLFPSTRNRRLSRFDVDLMDF